MSMSHLKTQHPRTLGSVRCINASSKVNISNFTKHLPNNNSNEKEICEGIHGSSLTVPPHSVSIKRSPRVSFNDKLRSNGNANQTSKLSSGNVISHENCKKKIQEGLSREKDLKNQTELLSRRLELLKMELLSKEEENIILIKQLEVQETKYTTYLNEERSDHEKTKIILSESNEKTMEVNKGIGEIIEVHREEIEKQKEESEKHLMNTIAEKDAVIADKDQKISRLKSQIADALKGNSWERQQQLDELNKELTRKQEESDMLRMKIRSMCKNKQN